MEREANCKALLLTPEIPGVHADLSMEVNEKDLETEGFGISLKFKFVIR